MNVWEIRLFWVLALERFLFLIIGLSNPEQYNISVSPLPKSSAAWPLLAILPLTGAPQLPLDKVPLRVLPTTAYAVTNSAYL